MTSPDLREQVTRAVGSYLDGGEAAGLVVGVIHGDRRGVFGFGKLARDDPSTPSEATLFEIGSIAKVFTALVLADMAACGEVALNDPICKHLPDSVHVPRRGEHEITLEHLATHTSGLPRLPANLNPKDMANPYADYTVADLYQFLSEFHLTRDVGAAYEYSNVGVGLLGHILGLVAGRPFEDLVIERICRPLGMDDTRIALDPKRAGRLAHGHDTGGNPVPNWDSPTLAGAGALRSTGRDMLAFLAANLDGEGRDVLGLLPKAIEACQQPRARRNPPRPSVWKRSAVVASLVALSLAIQSWWPIPPGRLAFAVAVLAPPVLSAVYGGLAPSLLATALVVGGAWRLWGDRFGWTVALVLGTFFGLLPTQGEWGSGAAARMGLGWHIDRLGWRGPQYLWHNGGTGGYASFTALVKEIRTAIILLSNSERSVDDAGRELLKSLTG